MFMMCVLGPCCGHVHIGFGILLLLDEGQMVAFGVRLACPLCPKVVGFIVFGRAYRPIYIKVCHRACRHFYGTC